MDVMSSGLHKKASTWRLSVWSVLGILLGTASIISLIQSWSQTTLAGLADSALGLYREMLLVFKPLMFGWWTPIEIFGVSYSVPVWGMDLLALYFVCLGAFIRLMRHRGWKLSDYIANFAWVIFCPISFFMLIWWRLRDIVVGRYALAPTSPAADRSRSITEVVMLLSPFFLTALFFLWNAIVLST